MAAVPKPSFGRLAGRGKPGNRRRDDDAPPRTGSAPAAPDTPDDGAEDQELSSYLKALSPDNDIESTGSGRRFGDAQVYQLRMTHAAGEQLSEVAAARGTSPQALALEWVLERLAWEAGSAPAEPPQADEPRPEEHTDPHQRPVPARSGRRFADDGALDADGTGYGDAGFGDGFSDSAAPYGAAPHGRAADEVPAEARTDEHYFDRTGWDEPRR
ncbi:hypothetical protein HQ32_03412 [Prauserella sp. Am3]|nr:hypothetical protein HQ32_03412 [Prauserella sp. Am3]